MSSYDPPDNFNPIFNDIEYYVGYSSLTLAEADKRYLRLTGGTVIGLVSCAGGISTNKIYNSTFTYSMPSASGTLALLSDIPSLATYLTASSSPNISGNWLYNQNSLQLKSNNSFYGICNAPNGLGSNLTYTFPSSSGTIALTSDIPSLSLYTKYDSPYTITGNWLHSIGSLQLKSNTAFYGICNAPTGLGSNLTYTFPSSSGTIALTSDIITPTQLSLDDGSLVTPSLRFTSSPSTGIYKSAPATLTIATAAGETLTCSSTQIYAARDLTVRGGYSGTYDFRIYRLGYTPMNILTTGNDTEITYAGTATINAITSYILQTNTATRLTVSTSTITSTLPILIPDGSVSAPSIRFSGDTDTGIYRAAANQLDIVTNGSSRLKVLSTGITEDGTLTITSSSGTNTHMDFVPSGSASLTSTCTGNYTFQTGSGNGYFKKSNTSLWSFYRDDSNTGDSLLQLLSDVSGTGSLKWTVYCNGDTKSSTGSYGTISDKRMKKEITDARDTYIDDLIKLKLKKYKLKNLDQDMLGLLAQDVQEIFPGLVSQSNDDPDEIDENTGETYKPLGIKTSVLIYPLISSVQWLYNENKKIKDELLELEQRIINLENK